VSSWSCVEEKQPDSCENTFSEKLNNVW